MSKHTASSFLVFALLFLASCTPQSNSQNVSSGQSASQSVSHEGLERRSTPLQQGAGISWVERYYERKPVRVDDFYQMYKDEPWRVNEQQEFLLQGTVNLITRDTVPEGDYPEDVQLIFINGTGENAIGCVTDEAHADDVYVGKADVIVQGRLRKENVNGPDFFAMYPCSFPGRTAHYSSQPEAVAFQPNCIADLKREAFIFGVAIGAFMETWDDVVRQIDRGTTSANDIAVRFGESVNALQNARFKLAALSSDTCPPEAKELTGLALELETTARDFQGFFEGERMLARVAVQMTKFEELSERLMGVFLRIQAL